MSPPRSAAAPTAALALALVVMPGCGAERSQPLPPDVVALSDQLEATSSSPTEQSRRALELAMDTVIAAPGSECPGCSRNVWLERAGASPLFVIEIEDPSGPVASVHLIYRSDLRPGELGSWTEAKMGDHFADSQSEDQLVLWPGRFEVRVFPARQGQADPERLVALAGIVPMDDLSRL